MEHERRREPFSIQGKSILIGQRGELGDMFLKRFTALGATCMVVGEDLVALLALAPKYDVVVVHLFFTQDDDTEMFMTFMERLWSLNRNIVLLQNIHDEITGPVYIEFEQRGCLVISRSSRLLAQKVADAIVTTLNTSALRR